MTGVWKRAPWTTLIFGVCVALAACSDSGSGNADGAAGTDGSVCGTHAHPGVLKLTGLSPAIGSTVVNQGIVHGFVVVNAPAVFTNFGLNPGASHTAGPSTPGDLKFGVTASASGSDLIYQLTVDRWAYAPGHVESRGERRIRDPEGLFLGLSLATVLLRRNCSSGRRHQRGQGRHRWRGHRPLRRSDSARCPGRARWDRRARCAERGRFIQRARRSAGARRPLFRRGSRAGRHDGQRPRGGRGNDGLEHRTA